MTITDYCSQFSRLTRAPGPMWGSDTKNRAPHKPLLLMSVMDLIARGAIASRRISITDELVELNDIFTDYWREVVPVTRSSSIAFPFSRLHTEPFWKLVPQPGLEITRPLINSISSVAQLRHLASGAEIDEELYQHMTNVAGRSALADALLRSCFSEKKQHTLSELSATHGEAFRYACALERAAHTPQDQTPTTSEEFRFSARTQGFRRAIVMNYNHRCAFCGTRIVTSEGHTAVDAAHIVPWRVSQNDDIRNGMALCKLCHWGFDEGLIGVSDSYSVVLSNQLAQAHNAPGALLTLSGRGILGPKEREFWPLADNLLWHRKAFSL